MRLLLFIICVIIAIPGYGQSASTSIDTSDYLRGETNINLLIAADKGYSTEVLRLLDKGAEINYSTYDGVTALMYAAQRGHNKVVQILLEKGADPNLKPNDGNSALHGAVMFNNLDVVEILLNNGADIDIRNKSGATPLMIAAGYDYFILTDMLLFYGADTNTKDKKGNDALLTATYKENIEIVDLLLQHGANVNTSDDKGFTPLMIAAQYNNQVLIEIFLDHDANVNKLNSFGYNALSYAVINQNDILAKQLIEMGADVNVDLDYSTTPLTIARQTNNDSLKNLLLQHGAKRNPYPDFSDVNFGPFAVFNTNDFRVGMNVQLHESKYKLNIVGSYEIRPARKRVWRKQEDDVFLQFWETRHVVTSGLQKTITFSKKDPEKFFAFHLAAKGGYSFGSYRGYLQNAKSNFFFTPEAGLSVLRPNSILKIGYAYMPFDNTNVNAHQFKIEYLFTIFLHNKRYKNKDIRWLD